MDNSTDTPVASKPRHNVAVASRKARIALARQGAARARWGEEVAGKSAQIRCGTAEAKALRAYAARAGLPISVAASRAIRRYLGLDGGGE